MLSRHLPSWAGRVMTNEQFFKFSLTELVIAAFLNLHCILFLHYNKELTYIQILPSKLKEFG